MCCRRFKTLRLLLLSILVHTHNNCLQFFESCNFKMPRIFILALIVSEAVIVLGQADSCADKDPWCPDWREFCRLPTNEVSVLQFDSFIRGRCRKTCRSCNDPSPPVFDHHIPDGMQMPPVHCVRSINETELMQLPSDLTQFALNLYGEAVKLNEGKNIFFSPFSISAAFAMLAEGAKGNSATQLYNALVPKSGFSRNLRTLFTFALQNINRKEKPYQLDTANAAYVEQTYEVSFCTFFH